MQRRPLGYWRYSPLMLGIPGSLCTGMFLLGAMLVSGTPLPMAWRGVLLVFPISSLILHMVSTRVLFVRVSDLIGISLVMAATIALAIALLKMILEIGDLIVLGGVLGVVSSSSLAGFYWDQRSWFRAQLPCGYDGMLDERSGRVDPYAPTPQQSTRQQNHGALKNTSLQIAGGIILAQIILALLTDVGKLVFLLLVVAIIVMGFGVKAGRVSSVCLATWRWERQHGKQIHVIR